MPSANRQLRPFVVTNFAITADGKISTRNKTPATFSSKNDKRRMQEIRAEADAILVGAGTVAADAMSMGISAADLRAQRIAKNKPAHPLRVIVSNSGKISPTLKIFQHDFSPIHIFTTSQISEKSRAALAQKATLHIAAKDEGDSANRQVDLVAMMTQLRRDLGVKRLLCEGGATLLRSLLAHDLVDEICLTLCPQIFGGHNAPTLTGILTEHFPASIRFKLTHFEPTADSECFLRYRILR